jgi:hypothetical protein
MDEATNLFRAVGVCCCVDYFGNFGGFVTTGPKPHK